jgi:cadmium resistance protein CadD (predicted permease)
MEELMNEIFDFLSKYAWVIIPLCFMITAIYLIYKTEEEDKHEKY